MRPAQFWRQYLKNSTQCISNSRLALRPSGGTTLRSASAGNQTKFMTLLQKLRALAATEAKATPGKWHVHGTRPSVVSDGQYRWVAVTDEGFATTPEERESNAALIAESRNLLKSALALVEAQHEALSLIIVAFYGRVHSRDAGAALESIRAALQLANHGQP